MLEQTSLLQFIIYFGKNCSEGLKAAGKSPRTQSKSHSRDTFSKPWKWHTDLTQEEETADHRAGQTPGGSVTPSSWHSPGLLRQICSLCTLCQQEGGMCSINQATYCLWGILAQATPVLMGSYGPLKVRRFPEEAEESIYGWRHLLLAPKQQQMLLLRESRKLLQGVVCSRCEPMCDICSEKSLGPGFLNFPAEKPKGKWSSSDCHTIINTNGSVLSPIKYQGRKLCSQTPLTLLSKRMTFLKKCYNGGAQKTLQETITVYKHWEAGKSYIETSFSLAHGIPGAFTTYVIISYNKESFIYEHTYTRGYYNKPNSALPFRIR